VHIVMRSARADEAEALSSLALRSKAQWGYDAAFLDACRPALTFGPEDLGAPHAVVAEVDGEVAGFYTLKGTLPEGELDNLWVEPRRMRTGVGRRLWEHAMAAATSIGLTAVLIDADPNAEGFYLAMGAERVGTTPSTTFPGRLLPRMRYRLS
jgi:GNAT superfamily N-acetyltransferase